MKRGAAFRAFMLAAIFALAATAILAWPGVARFVAIDRCIDGGGTWDQVRHVCCLTETDCEQPL